MRIIDGPFVDLGVTRDSHGDGINYAQPFVSAQNWLALVNLGGTVNLSKTLQDGVPVTNNLGSEQEQFKILR